MDLLSTIDVEEVLITGRLGFPIYKSRIYLFELTHLDVSTLYLLATFCVIVIKHELPIYVYVCIQTLRTRIE